MLAWLAAAQGDADTCRALAAECLKVAVASRIASAVTLGHWALGLNALADGQPRRAVRLLGEVCAPGGTAGHFMLGALVLPDFVEACVRAGEPQRAREALHCAGARFLHDGDGPLGAARHRCHALLAEDNEAQALFTAALEARPLAAFDAGRTRLLYGEWLRRCRRVRAAREQLRRAENELRGIGATPWADMARRELRAAGATLPAQCPAPALPGNALLTARELQVSRLAAQGLSNAEIAERLFLSPGPSATTCTRCFPSSVSRRGPSCTRCSADCAARRAPCGEVGVVSSRVQPADRARPGRCRVAAERMHSALAGPQSPGATGSGAASSASSTASPFALAHSVSMWIGSMSVAPSGVSSYSTRGGTSA